MDRTVILLRGYFALKTFYVNQVNYIISSVRMTNYNDTWYRYQLIWLIGMICVTVKFAIISWKKIREKNR